VLSHTNLKNYYTTIFAMAQHHKYSIEELENLIPFERDIYVEMLLEYLKAERERKEKAYNQ
jgi:hypothetical protein